jgi:hypothetical protein
MVRLQFLWQDIIENVVSMVTKLETIEMTIAKRITFIAKRVWTDYRLSKKMLAELIGRRANGGSRNVVIKQM